MHNLFMMNQQKQVFMSGLILAILSLTGCNGGSTLPEGETGTVTGKVTFNGNPVPAGAAIVFLHKDKGIAASSAIAPDGTYSLRMRREAPVLVGDYQIGVTPPTVELTPAEAEAVNMGKTIPEKEWPEIPKAYRNPETSGVSFNVKAGENIFDLDMK